jgi:hypothetical protein
MFLVAVASLVALAVSASAAPLQRRFEYQHSFKAPFFLGALCCWKTFAFFVSF